MKRLKILLYGVLCIILLFTFSCATGKDCEKTSDSVKIAWDPTGTFENGSPISIHEAVKYNVYIRKYNDPEDSKELIRKEITEAVCEISFKERGKYYVGVEAVLDTRSEISWSCDPEKCANKKPFCVEFK